MFSFLFFICYFPIKTKSIYENYLPFISTVCLTVPPKIVPFTFGEGPAQTGQALNVQCFVSDGDLPLKIKWILNRKVLESDQDVAILSIGKRGSSLTIEPVGANHAGNYTCYAQNFVGSTEFSSELKVIGCSRIFFHSNFNFFVFFFLKISQPVL